MSTEKTPVLENETEEAVSHYPMHKVIMHNDDKTTFDFVIFILTSLFEKSEQEASNLAMEIHKSGSALAGVYTFEHAEMRVDQVISLARANKYPLTCTIEKA